VTTDIDAQFQSALLAQFKNVLGCEHIRTTPYHLAGHGLTKRIHRQLKALLHAQAGSRWAERSPLIMLSIRWTLKVDIG
jgi:hypothetical protein